MRLFSKRYKQIRRPNLLYRDSNSINRLPLPVNEATRNRLKQEIRFLTSRDEYMEPFLLFEDKNKGKIFFDSEKLDDFSLSELGYKFSDFFKFENFSIIEQTDSSISINQKYYDDFKFLDLIEFIIIFSKKDKREDIINRFNRIFSEENTNFSIEDGIVVRKMHEDIQTIIPILKDNNLKTKLEHFYNSYNAADYVSSAKISADIINIIFSDYTKNGKKQAIEELLENISKKSVVLDTKTRKNQKEGFKNHLNDLLKDLKDLTNDIYDIRHSEKSTIYPSNNYIYKMISDNNISIAEFTILSLKKDFISKENMEDNKNSYIKKYGIDKNTRVTLEKINENILDSNFDEDDIINIDDIPF